MTLEEIVGVIQQTPMTSLQIVHPGVQKALETDGETHILTLLMKDAIERGIKGIHIQTRYGVTKDFVHKYVLEKEGQQQKADLHHCHTTLGSFRTTTPSKKKMTRKS